MADIVSRKDIQQLVDLFYKRVQANTVLAPFFSHVTWDSHLGIMYNFWSSMILGDQSYQGHPLHKHLPLPIAPVHFKEWVALFTSTVDELYKGEKAEEIKMRAKSIAGVFEARMGLLKNTAST
jgi:hemoglobin